MCSGYVHMPIERNEKRGRVETHKKSPLQRKTPGASWWAHKGVAAVKRSFIFSYVRLVASPPATMWLIEARRLLPFVAVRICRGPCRSHTSHLPVARIHCAYL